MAAPDNLAGQADAVLESGAYRPGEELHFKSGLVPLTEKHQSDIVSSNLKKGMEKDAVRGRQKREAAIGCKRLAPTGTGYRLGAAHRYVGWDGTSRYRGHERRTARGASRVEPWSVPLHP